MLQQPLSQGKYSLHTPDRWLGVPFSLRVKGQIPSVLFSFSVLNKNKIQSLIKSSSIFWNFSCRSGGTSMSRMLSSPISSSVLHSNTRTITIANLTAEKPPSRKLTYSRHSAYRKTVLTNKEVQQMQHCIV